MKHLIQNFFTLLLLTSFGASAAHADLQNRSAGEEMGYAGVKAAAGTAAWVWGSAPNRATKALNEEASRGSRRILNAKEILTSEAEKQRIVDELSRMMGASWKIDVSEGAVESVRRDLHAAMDARVITPEEKAGIIKRAEEALAKTYERIETNRTNWSSRPREMKLRAIAVGAGIFLLVDAAGHVIVAFDKSFQKQLSTKNYRYVHPVSFESGWNIIKGIPHFLWVAGSWAQDTSGLSPDERDALFGELKTVKAVPAQDPTSVLVPGETGVSSR